MAFGFVSCDNKNESIVQDEVSKIEAFENLFLDIKALNSIFQFDNESDSNSLRKRPWWQNLLLVAGADAFGGLWGHVGGAILLSSCALYEIDKNGYTVWNDDPYWSDVPLYEFVDSDVGALHNRLIGEMLFENPTLLDGSKSIDEIISIINAKLNEHNISSTVEELSNMYNDRAAIIIQKIVTSGNLANSMDEAILLYPELTNELQTFKVFLSGAENIQVDATMVRYTDNVLELVRESEIPTLSKEKVNSALSVYANSFILW